MKFSIFFYCQRTEFFHFLPHRQQQQHANPHVAICVVYLWQLTDPVCEMILFMARWEGKKICCGKEFSSYKFEFLFAKCISVIKMCMKIHPHDANSTRLIRHMQMSLLAPTTKKLWEWMLNKIRKSVLLLHKWLLVQSLAVWKTLSFIK